MRSTIPVGALVAAAVLVGCSDDPVAPPPPPPMPLETNGDFESGDLSGWTNATSSTFNADIFVLDTNTVGPISGTMIPMPPEGTYWALADQDGPAQHILYQDIAVPAGRNVAFAATIYINNQNADYVIAPNDGLSVTGTEANQQVRVDVMDTSAPIDGVGSGVLLNIHQTMPGDPLTETIMLTADLSQFAGQTVRIRFAAAVKEFFMQVGVDAVTVTAL